MRVFPYKRFHSTEMSTPYAGVELDFCGLRGADIPLSYVQLQQRKMIRIILTILLIAFHVKLAEAQRANVDNFNAHVENAISLSEQALYDTQFDDALLFIERSYFERFSGYESKHEIWLTIQNIRVQSFQSRLSQLSFNSDKYLNSLIALLPQVEIIDDKHIKAKFYSVLSALYRSTNLDLCVLYENKALNIFKSQDDYKSIAVLQATRISRN